MKKIVQINVRLNEGGAAAIALDIHQRLLQKKIYNSYFLYGYGKNANKNPQEENIFNCKMSASKYAILANYITYKLFNKDVFGVIDNKNKVINDADIIHLHVLHSYFMNFEKTIEKLLYEKKKIVWTIHDFWPLTGRCAMTDNCNQWQNGCGQCPTLNNYPPAWFDHSKKVRIKKMDIINTMLDSGAYLVSPSKHLYDNLVQVYGERSNITIIKNGIDIDSEKKIINRQCAPNNSDKTRVGIVAHDLSYNGKTNYKITTQILQSCMDTYEFHLVGKNNPFHGKNTVSHGYLSNKTELLNLISTFDCLLFTSQVDNYPLILCEALSLGVPVIATKSDASIEIINKVSGKVFSHSDIIKLFKNGQSDFFNIYNVNNKKELIQKAANVFSGNTMTEKYIGIYESLLNE